MVDSLYGTMHGVGSWPLGRGCTLNVGSCERDCMSLLVSGWAGSPTLFVARCEFESREPSSLAGSRLRERGYGHSKAVGRCVEMWEKEAGAKVTTFVDRQYSQIVKRGYDNPLCCLIKGCPDSAGKCPQSPPLVETTTICHQ